MADEKESGGLKDRLSRQGEEALGRLAEELAANSVVSSAIASAFEARERAVAAQEAAMGALGIPSAADIERLTRRIRSVSQRLEGIEDSLDRLDERLMGLDGLGDRLEAVAGSGGPGADDDGLERRLEEIRADVAALREAVVDPTARPVPRAQERLAVADADATAPPAEATAGKAASRRKASSRGGGSSGSRGAGSRGSRSGSRGSASRSAKSGRSGGSASPGSGSAR